MHNPTINLNWLNKKYHSLLEDLGSSVSDETNEKILEVLSINQQIQAQILLYILTELKQLERDTDNQLMEISYYLQDIVFHHIREAKNLEKVR